MRVILLMLTIAEVAAAAIVLFVSIISTKNGLRNLAFGALVVWSGLYFTLLLGSSLNSDVKPLFLNQPKKFCGFYLDSYMHEAVTSVRRTKQIGDRHAVGESYVVTVYVFSNAGRAHLGLKHVDTHVVDRPGEIYSRDMDAEKQLGPQPELTNVVGPEENFSREIVFDLPANVRDPRLDIRERMFLERVAEGLLIGDEDSLLAPWCAFQA